MSDEKNSPLLTVKDGGIPDRKTLKSLHSKLLDLDGHNFMGSGLNATEWFATMDVLRYDRWHGSQTAEEKRRRMKYVVLLCAEQKRLEDEDIQATGLSLALIENVIEGDWNSVTMWIEALKFREDRPDFRNRQAARFARFAEIAQEAYDTRPKVFCPLCVRPAPKDQVAAFRDGRHVCPWCDVVYDDAGTWTKKDRANLSPVEDDAP